MTVDRPIWHRALVRWLCLLGPVAVGAALGLVRSGMEPSTTAMVLVLTVVGGVAVTQLALWGRRQQEVAQRRDGYIAGLTQLLDLPHDTSQQARAREIGAAVASVLGADRCTWQPGAPAGNDAVVGTVGTVTRAGRHLAVGRSGLPTDAFTAVPVRRGGHVVGHFRVTTSTRIVRPTGEQLRVAALLADRMTGVGPDEPARSAATQSAQPAR